MANFAETIATNPPRLVVVFRRSDHGEEQYQWGVVGNMPILSLIGRISLVQSELLRGGWMPECTNEQPALVITLDAQSSDFDHFVHPDIPAESLCGMLELIKQMLVASRMGQHASAQRVQILGPDGSPMRQ